MEHYHYLIGDSKVKGFWIVHISWDVMLLGLILLSELDF